MVALPVATDATARSRDRETATSGRGPPSQEQERRRQRLQMQREPSLRSSSIAEGSVAKALSPRSPFAPAWIRSPAKRAWFRCLVAVPVVPVTEARSADSSCHPLARTDPRSSGLEAAQACGVGCGGRLRGGALTSASPAAAGRGDGGRRGRPEPECVQHHHRHHQHGDPACAVVQLWCDALRHAVHLGGS